MCIDTYIHTWIQHSHYNGQLRIQKRQLGDGPNILLTRLCISPYTCKCNWNMHGGKWYVLAQLHNRLLCSLGYYSNATQQWYSSYVRGKNVQCLFKHPYLNGMKSFCISYYNYCHNPKITKTSLNKILWFVMHVPVTTLLMI